ncbi:MAG: hypothetical protein WCG92_15630 [Hyphomicrobiales bacterium]
METLFAIGMMIGLIKVYAEPAKPPAPVAQLLDKRLPERHQTEKHQAAQKSAEAGKPRPRNKSEWVLSY